MLWFPRKHHWLIWASWLYNAKVFPYVSLTAATVRFRSLLLSFCVFNNRGNIRDTHFVIPCLLFDPEKLLLLAIALFRGSLIDALDAGGHSRRVMYRSNRSFNMPPPPPFRAYPGHLTPLPSRGGGNLTIRVFQGVGNLIPML